MPLLLLWRRLPMLLLVLLLVVALAAELEAAIANCAGVKLDDEDSDEGVGVGEAAVALLNFSQLADRLYGDGAKRHSWLLLLYSPFGGYWLDYAAEFGAFARRAAGWNHTVRLAAVNTARQENTAALPHYRVTGLPALYFIPKGAVWGVTRATQMPRDGQFLEQELLATLEKFVPSLKPISSVSRALRVSKSDLVVVIEDSDGDRARRAVLDNVRRGSQLQLVWRVSGKLPIGRLRVSVHRRQGRRRRYIVRLRPVLVVGDAPAELDALIDAAVSNVDDRLRRFRTASRVTKLRAKAPPPSAPSPPTLCHPTASERHPPTAADLSGDAWHFLHVGVAKCLANANTAAWPAVSSFVRFAAAALGPTVDTDDNTPAAPHRPSLLAVAAALPRRPPSVGRWRRLLAVVAADSSLDAPSGPTDTWRLLQAMTVARIRDPHLPAVLPMVARLRRVCGPQALLPLPDGSPLLPAGASSAAELLALWRWRNLLAGRHFPPARLCPGCRLDDDGDVLRFLTGWYGAVLTESKPGAGLRRSTRWRAKLALVEALDDAGPSSEEPPPCVLQLLRGGADWGRLAALGAVSCACSALLVWRLGACD